MHCFEPFFWPLAEQSEHRVHNTIYQNFYSSRNLIKNFIREVFEFENVFKQQDLYYCSYDVSEKHNVALIRNTSKIGFGPVISKHCLLSSSYLNVKISNSWASFDVLHKIKTVFVF